MKEHAEVIEKLAPTKGELVKLLGQQMEAEAAVELEAAAERSAAELRTLHNLIVMVGREAHFTLLDIVMRNTSGGNTDRLQWEVHFVPNDTSGCEVTFRDGKSYDCRFSLRLYIHFNDACRAQHITWLKAVAEEDVARARDMKVRALREDAKQVILKEALDSTEEGRAVLEAMKTLRKKLREETKP